MHHNILFGTQNTGRQKLKFYETTALPCLMYGSETWTLRRTDETRLEVWHVAGYALWGKKRSDEMRSQPGMRKLDKQIHERKKNWLEHQHWIP
jgi:hypothetical protein